MMRAERSRHHRLSVGRVIGLTAHPAFDAKTPNRLRAVVASFSQLNPSVFHDPSGAGYRFLADQILVPPGSVAVVRAGPTAYYLVTDLGFRYAVPSDTVLQILGYDPAQAVDVPANLLTRVPPGPALDPAAAVQPAGPGADLSSGTAPLGSTPATMPSAVKPSN